MIKIEKVDVYGFETAIRGMRNAYNSWDKSDSYPSYRAFLYSDFIEAQEAGLIGKDAQYAEEEASYLPDGTMLYSGFILGTNDLKLMRSLAKAGNDHGKYARMINVTMDITAPLYWWKEFDTYKVGTVANSCSTMHKIASKEFTLDDFSCEHLCEGSKLLLKQVIDILNTHRYYFNNYEDEKDDLLIDKKTIWWQMIQLLPSSYNQKRTVQLNYQVLWSMYKARKDHKLDEWREFCKYCEALPYFCEIFGIEKEE